VPSTKWSDDTFLDELRHGADPQADDAVARLYALHTGEQRIITFFAALRHNDSVLAETAPEPLRQFLADTRTPPPADSLGDLELGARAFRANSLPAVVVLLASSLPRGYGAPCLNRILAISGNLSKHPYQRLMGVVQLLVNISDDQAFAPGGRAIITAQKLRLLHAGIRLVARSRPPADLPERDVVPVNHEDMLATIMAFSSLVVDGLERLRCPMRPGDAEAFYALWREFARLMGIYPPGQPHDTSLVPATLSEAREFYVSYVRRNNVTVPPTASDAWRTNALGCQLTQQNLLMMRQLLPWQARALGLGLAPRLAMTDLMAADELTRVGITPLLGRGPLRAALHRVLAFGQWAGTHDTFVGKLSHAILQGMVDVDRRGEVEFAIPFRREDLLGPAFR
jgi:hypothetical protein